MMRKMKVFRLLAFVVVLTMLMGSIPVSAAKSVKVGTTKKLVKELKASSVKTITFSTKSSKTITIPKIANSKNKKLIISTKCKNS